MLKNCPVCKSELEKWETKKDAWGPKIIDVESHLFKCHGTTKLRDSKMDIESCPNYLNVLFSGKQGE